VIRRAAIVPDNWKGFQPAAVSMSANRIDVFALGDDRRVWHNVWTGKWLGWKDDVGDKNSLRVPPRSR
jgi:hypothetical protein